METMNDDDDFMWVVQAYDSETSESITYDMRSNVQFPDIDHNLDLLVEYLMDMGTCGRYFSVHDQLKDRWHSDQCERAMKALELAAPFKVRAELVVNIAGVVVNEVVEMINGGYFHTDGLYLEAPPWTEAIFERIKGLPRPPSDKPVRRQREAAALRIALRHCYTSLQDVDLSMSALIEAGLPSPALREEIHEEDLW